MTGFVELGTDQSVATCLVTDDPRLHNQLATLGVFEVVANHSTDGGDRLSGLEVGELSAVNHLVLLGIVVQQVKIRGQAQFGESVIRGGRFAWGLR
jgi:hypothetical protein